MSQGLTTLIDSMTRANKSPLQGHNHGGAK